MVVTSRRSLIRPVNAYLGVAVGSLARNYVAAASCRRSGGWKPPPLVKQIEAVAASAYEGLKHGDEFDVVRRPAALLQADANSGW